MEEQQHLPRPHRVIDTEWTIDEIREALEKSREALLNNLSSISTSTSTSQPFSLLINLPNVENLFLVDTTLIQEGKVDWIGYDSYGTVEAVERGGWEWGSRDMMLDLRDATDQFSRMAILMAAAGLTGGALHLLDLDLTEEEERGWVEALSIAADRHAGPTTLLIQESKFRDVHGLLSALKRNKRLKHLSLQRIIKSSWSSECVEVLRHFTSLTSLHLQDVKVSSKEDIVGKLAELHPSHSPLAASLHRLHIHSPSIDWGRSTGFLRHWPHLKELSLVIYHDMTEEEVMDFVDHLALPKKEEAETVGSSTASSPPQLYSLQLGRFKGTELSRSATAAVVDALSRSGLPFFELNNRRKDPAVEAQLWRNQRNYMLGLDLKRVPATSIRLFICGDPFAGKTTLVSSMRSIYGRKRDRARALFTGGRTQGIEVQAIEKDGIRVSLWDMAGQQEFHAFHDCMFPDIGTSSYQFPSMFMFVWSPMESRNHKKGSKKKNGDFEASFRYWLKFLASKSRQSIIPLKVILVFTRADQMEHVSSSVSDLIDSLRSDFKRVIDIVDSPFDVCARKKASVKPVAECIFTVAKDVLQGIELYDICPQVSKNLLNYSNNTNERIITWEQFSKICNNNDKAKLNAIAMSLNESGNIIYISGFKHIILDPNWFCNQIVGSLIGFSTSKGSSKDSIVFNKGCIPRKFLEQRFKSITKSEVCGSLLVELMEAMHLCCEVPSSNGKQIFIPAILSKDEPREQLQWTSSTSNSHYNLEDDKDRFVYMGRRLECENEDLTFLTPGLFPRIQILLNNAFKSENDNVDITLGNDFISIRFLKSEIIVMFCQSKSNHVIDVLVRADQNINTKTDKLHILAFVQTHIVNTLIKICAQPTGVQGVRLIESIIRPDCCCDLSKGKDREDQCVKLTYLKEQLRIKLEQGKETSYDWKYTKLLGCLTNDFIDLLGFKDYDEVLVSYKAWLEEEAQAPLLENNDVNISREQQHVAMTSLEYSLVEEYPILEDQPIEVHCCKHIAKEILSLHSKVDATHKELLKLHMKMDQMANMLDEIHKELQIMRKDVIIRVKKSIAKLLKLALENEAKKQLPRVPLLTKVSESNLEKFLTKVPRVLGLYKIVKIQLFCEDKNLPHPVENQPGINLTSLSESHSKYLEKALPYINGFLNVLTVAARLGISSMVPLASSLIPDWTPHLKLAKQYPMVQSTLKSKQDTCSLSTLNSSSKEWQKCLASILMENGGLTDENIAHKFCLQRAIYYEADGTTRVAWLCKTHYIGQQPFSLG